MWCSTDVGCELPPPASTDKFRRVIGYLSSFTQMPGGNPYPGLIPSVPRKPLRIFMQAGHRDLRRNEPEWNWLAHNLRVAAALAEAGYDFRLVLGDGGHSPNHGGVLLPDALRWLWRSDEGWVPPATIRPQGSHLIAWTGPQWFPLDST